MNIYCLGCKEHTQTVKPIQKTTPKGRAIVTGKCKKCKRNKVKMVKGGSIASIASAAYDRVSNFVKGRKPSSPELMKLLADHGTEKIERIIVCREPIEAGVKFALNIISKGMFEKITKELNYDNMFHLFMCIITSQGSYIIERNEIVRAYNGSPRGEQFPINMKGQSLTINTFIENALKKEGENIFVYDAFKNNCQDFIITLLKDNLLLTQDAYKFIKQDTTQLIKQMPSYTQSMSNNLTSFAARMRTLLGQGF